MTGPLSFSSGNYYHAGAQSLALPASGTDHLEATSPPLRNEARQQSNGESQPTKSKQSHQAILNFLRNPQNQPVVPVSQKTSTQNAGAKSMEVSTGAKPAEIAYDPVTGMYMDTTTGTLIDPATGQPYIPSTVAYPGGYYGVDPSQTGYLDPSFVYSMGGYENAGVSPYGNGPTNCFPQNPNGNVDYASLGYAAPAPQQPTQQVPEQTSPAPAQESPPGTVPAPSGYNQDPTKMGDGNDSIVIPAKVDPDADAETQKQQQEALKKLTKSTDVLDLGFGNNELTIEADNRKGTIKLTNCGSPDTVYIKGKNNKLTIQTDERKDDSEHSLDKVVLAGNSKDWTMEKQDDGSIKYINHVTQNEITVTGDAEVVTDDCGKIKDPDASISDEDKIPAELKMKLEKMSAKEIATQIDMDKLSKDPEEKELLQDYVALKFVLCMDNDFSGANDQSFWNFFGKDDLTDDAFSSDDLERCVGAARAINPKLADKVQIILDNMDDLTSLDNDTSGPNLSRSELEKILDGISKGNTLGKLVEKGANTET
jgi:hypothetical protein